MRSAGVNRAAGVAALAFLLGGCLEDEPSASVTFFQPGVYKGAPDSLNADIDALNARFAGQTDR
ncbi:MAG: hypothetical protein MPK62_05950 [Alphaproteobacteria bacterium]|nr:hypothetical protein [Alphaproteobacteria bacterium]